MPETAVKRNIKEAQCLRQSLETLVRELEWETEFNAESGQNNPDGYMHFRSLFGYLKEESSLFRDDTDLTKGPGDDIEAARVALLRSRIRRKLLIIDRLLGQNPENPRLSKFVCSVHKHCSDLYNKDLVEFSRMLKSLETARLPGRF